MCVFFFFLFVQFLEVSNGAAGAQKAQSEASCPFETALSCCRSCSLTGSDLGSEPPNQRGENLSRFLLSGWQLLSCLKDNQLVALDTSIIGPLARDGSVRRVCGDLEESFWSSITASWRDIKRNLHWFFFFFWHLLNFCPAPAGGPPCQCGFHGDAVNAGSENRLLELERGGRSSGSLHRLSSFLAASAAAWMFSAS